jgi:hypothetical protein
VVAARTWPGHTTCRACSSQSTQLPDISTLCPSQTAWQRFYGNIPHQRKVAFAGSYATGETLLPSPTLNFTTLVTTASCSR